MISQSSIRNQLLQTLGTDDFALIAPHLTDVDLARGDALTEPNTIIRYSWFPTSGVASVVAMTASGSQAEVGVVGREGMVSISTLHGVGEAPLRCFVQMPGRALRIGAGIVREAMTRSSSFERLMLAYAEAFSLQMASTALAFATRTIEQRLARWLLMCDDRIDDGSIGLTHEALSLMLGVRRAGVTVALRTLEQRGMINTRRGEIRVVDRCQLARLADDSYGGAETDYTRLLTPAAVKQNGAASPADRLA